MINTMMRKLKGDKKLDNFLLDVQEREVSAKKPRNVTGMSLSYLYFELSEKDIFAAVRKEESERTPATTLIVRKIDEDSFLYNSNSKEKKIGKTDDYMFEDALGVKGFIKREEFDKFYKFEEETPEDKKALEYSFDVEKKNSNMSTFARKTKLKM